MAYGPSEETTPRQFRFVGNHPCLDFVNTQCRPAGEIIDLLRDFGDLIAWLRRTDLIDAARAREALTRWSSPRQARYALGEARKFRDALRRMAEALVRGRSVPRASITAINEILSRPSWRYGVAPTALGFERKLVLNLSSPRDLLVPLAFAAVDLLSERELTRIRRCKNRKCIGFFYDSSRNRQRRWCSMAVCGNRAKAAAYYRRQKRIARESVR